MRRAPWAALLLLLFATSAAAATEAKPPKLVTLSNVRPAELIATFNADAAHPRLVVMFSPT
jgi:hypothetical protein